MCTLTHTLTYLAFHILHALIDLELLLSSKGEGSRPTRPPTHLVAQHWWVGDGHVWRQPRQPHAGEGVAHRGVRGGVGSGQETTSSRVGSEAKTEVLACIVVLCSNKHTCRDTAHAHREYAACGASPGGWGACPCAGCGMQGWRACRRERPPRTEVAGIPDWQAPLAWSRTWVTG